ncbi:MAG TPA: hypothetical protein PLS46_15155 [Microthrixaceae bacterium]|nr:hypothetical protein [Microthrixaceae bacterium]
MQTNTSSISSLGAVIREFLAPLAEVVGELEPLHVPLPHAVDVLDAFVELRRLGEAGVVLMSARAVESGEWQRAGRPNPADWLAARQGTSPGRARSELSTSRRLGGLPDTTDALRSGELSAELAGAVADGATANPAAEHDLLDTARRDSLRHTRHEAARRKAEVESELTKRQREKKAQAERTASWGVKNGRAWLYAEGPLGSGAELQQALQNRVGELFAERRSLPASEREGRDQYAYDALLELVCGRGAAPPSAAADGVADGSGDGAAATPGARQRTRRVSIRKLMLVRVDLAALIRGQVGEGEVCEIPGVGPVSVAEARAMYGDAIVRLVTTNGPAVVDVINPSRRPTEAQRIARLWTDPKCVVEGCDRQINLEYEHRDDFARTRHTVLDESEHMCEHDHDLKTRQNWQLVEGTGRRAFVPPSDPRHPDHLRLADTG